MKNNNFFNNKWAVRFVSLLFAVFLYMFVATENNQFIQAGLLNNTSVNVTETVSNVPVIVGETDDEVFVSGLPETVTVRVTGPRNIINQVTSDDIFAVTEDLTGVEPGSHNVRLELGGITSNSDVEYQITPSRVVVEVGRMASVEVPVTYEIADGAIADGYQVTNVSLSPSEVTLTGKDEDIQQVENVSINITSDSPQSSSFSDTYVVQVQDANGDLLDINVSSSEVEAQVDVASSASSVDVSLVPQGEDTENYQYEYAFVEQSTVEVFGTTEAINSISQVPAVIDVSGMTSSDIVTAHIQMPDGIDNVSPVELSVEVTITPKNNSETDQPGEEESSDEQSLDENPVPDETQPEMELPSDESEQMSESSSGE